MGSQSGHRPRTHKAFEALDPYIVDIKWGRYVLLSLRVYVKCMHVNALWLIHIEVEHDIHIHQYISIVTITIRYLPLDELHLEAAETRSSSVNSPAAAVLPLRASRARAQTCGEGSFRAAAKATQLDGS